MVVDSMSGYPRWLRRSPEAETISRDYEPLFKALTALQKAASLSMPTPSQGKAGGLPESAIAAFNARHHVR